MKKLAACLVAEARDVKYFHYKKIIDEKKNKKLIYQSAVMFRNRLYQFLEGSLVLHLIEAKLAMTYNAVSVHLNGLLLS